MYRIAFITACLVLCSTMGAFGAVEIPRFSDTLLTSWGLPDVFASVRAWWHGGKHIGIETNRGDSGDQYLTPEARADKIQSMPGWGELDFNMFGGYVTVDESAGRALYYMFVESPRAQTDPLVLWLNGGPGCSSLGGGLMSELGPFYPTLDGQLMENEWAWSREANVIFVESPAFVGFSYSNTSADADVGDERTAKDMREFMIRFLERHPQFADRPFWISGESYGGHYVPGLALEIVRGNQHSPQPQINLQGFLVGNAWTDPPSDNRGAADFWYEHALISRATYDGLLDNCNFSHVGPLLSSSSSAAAATAATASVKDGLGSGSAGAYSEAGHKDASASKDNHRCNDHINNASTEMGRVNIYQVYADVCLSDFASTQGRRMREAVQGAPPASMLAAHLAFPSDREDDKRREQQQQQQQQQQKKQRAAGKQGASNYAGDGRYDPCIDDEVEVYLNRRDVQDAMHANTSGLPTQSWRWSDCTGRVRYSQKDMFSSMLPTYHELLKHDGGKLKMLVFSGDIDGIVPVTGTRRWLETLDLEITKPWRPWESRTGQVGGYVVEHAGQLTFATVRHAGHMCPYTQPERTFWMFTHFVHGKPL